LQVGKGGEIPKKKKQRARFRSVMQMEGELKQNSKAVGREQQCLVNRKGYLQSDGVEPGGRENMGERGECGERFGVGGSTGGRAS